MSSRALRNMFCLCGMVVHLVLLANVYSVPAVVPAKNGIKEGAVGFPETEENPAFTNKENRKPVYIPATCPANELFYPGDQKDDWICDCRPAYIYHPSSDTCWAAWERGPCTEKQYLVLPPNSVIPTCQENTCNDGQVPWGTKCETLGSMQPCAHLFPRVVAVLGVNATTLAIECVTLSVSSRSSETNSINNVCLPGCRRNVKGKCTQRSEAH